MSSRIPVIDLSSFNINRDHKQVSKEEITALASQVHQAFSDIGFLYLKNHGISDHEIASVFEAGNKFFSLPQEVKGQYKRGELTENHGWLPIGGEKFDERPADYKECYDVNPPLAKTWPDKVLPKFQCTTKEFYRKFRLVGARIMELIAIGLELKDSQYFNKNHNIDNFTYTCMRYLHYPPMPSDKEWPSDQLRCGEHTDYGTITLLLQDSAGGLQVYDKDLGYVDATPIPGTILVNIGDLMQRWTSDKLVSTKHRVLRPAKEACTKSRMSVVCFIHPDADCVVQTIDGGSKYEPVTAENYLHKRYQETLM